MNRLEYPEGATPIDPDEARGLILTHITTRGELDRWEQDNIAEALAWLDKIKPIDILNGIFIRKLHHRMFKNVWRWAGEFRLTNKNLGNCIIVCLKMSGDGQENSGLLIKILAFLGGKFQWM